MKANRDCPFCMDEREDGPPHPYINLGVWFDGITVTDSLMLAAEAYAMAEAFTKLYEGGGRICSRDGRHIMYVPGSYDPWPLVEVTKDG
jgi:hypothetical protein